MRKRIFITATNTNIGKTYVTKLLLKDFTKKGYRVGVLKPIETGVINRPEDATKLYELTCKLNPEFKNLSLDDIVPITYKLPAAPFVASNGKALEIKKIDDAIQKIEQYCDILFIEGAGGLLVPIDEKYFMIDLALHVQATIFLVSHCSLGCINDTLLNIRLLELYNSQYKIIFNCKKDKEQFKTISAPYFKKILKEILFTDENISYLSDKLL